MKSIQIRRLESEQDRDTGTRTQTQTNATTCITSRIRGWQKCNKFSIGSIQKLFLVITVMNTHFSHSQMTEIYVDEMSDNSDNLDFCYFRPSDILVGGLMF